MNKSFNKILFLVLAMLFAAAITVQIFLAGAAIFIHPSHWQNHTMFVHLFGFNLPVIMLLVAFFAKTPRWAYWYIFSMLLGVFMMYFTANITSNLPWLGGYSSCYCCISRVGFLQISIKNIAFY
ncbi:DUF6220 domain-containing protein [Gracilibacillus sp. JCM 18860]|uniref:DUF6220 domain-containing protein n=1 Tax=Gracilibacillus sp. JCM 18860 TaxID=1306159 RepID=UPI0006D04681